MNGRDATRMSETNVPSAHMDSFCADRLPPRDLWPVRDFTGIPELAYPPRLNCATELLDGAIAHGHGDRVALRSPTTSLAIARSCLPNAAVR